MTDRISLKVGGRGSLDGDLVAVGCCEGEEPATAGFAEEVRLALGRLAGRDGFKGKEEQVLETEAVPGGALIALHGLGPRDELTFFKLARWLARVAEAARSKGIVHAGIVLPPHPETAGPRAAERLLRTALLSAYRFDRFITETETAGRLQAVSVVAPPGQDEAYRAAHAFAERVADAVVAARDLANTPPNVATPGWMQERAAELALRLGATLTVLDAAELLRRGMGGLLAVGSGSNHPPRLLRLTLGERGPAIALVGKGVTFDTGGISIKPAANMDEMKYDKSGACATLGAFQAAAELGLPLRLAAYLPLAENMPSGGAYRPGDIVRCYNGKTVEVLDTDAEGRMILADALAWAAEEKPDAILEFSTLTGACMIALGDQAAGLFAPDDALAGQLLRAADDAGERIWRLPLFPENLEELKGTHADLKNVAGRYGGASKAAAFLSQFVGGVGRWAHLDIAGVANVKPQPGGPPAGATGFGVALTVTWLRSLVG
jgi:leucyl aminopeptidase